MNDPWAGVGPMCKCDPCEEMRVFLDLLNDPDFDMHGFLVLAEFFKEEIE